MHHDQDQPTTDQAQQGPVNTYAIQEESAEETIARLEQRTKNLKTYGNGLKDTAAVLAQELEDMRVLYFRADKSRSEHAEALDAARDLLCVFPGEPEAFFRALILRKRTLENTVKLALEFIRLTTLNPEKLRTGPYIYLKPGHVADHVAVLSVLIQSIGAQLQGGQSITHIPVDPEEMAAWVKENAGKVKTASKEPEPTGPVYWCPACRCHVAPEDVRPYYADVPAYTGNDHYHSNPESGRGCGNKVERLTMEEAALKTTFIPGSPGARRMEEQSRGRAVRVPVEPEPSRPHGDVDPEPENLLTTERLGVEGWHCPACKRDLPAGEVYQIAPNTTPVHNMRDGEMWTCGASLERKEAAK